MIEEFDDIYTTAYREIITLWAGEKLPVKLLERVRDSGDYFDFEICRETTGGDQYIEALEIVREAADRDPLFSKDGLDQRLRRVLDVLIEDMILHDEDSGRVEVDHAHPSPERVAREEFRAEIHRLLYGTRPSSS